MSQYIGKTISLISNKGLRYVGILDKISAEDATVSLKSVRPFGTEGRMAEQGQPSMEVMPGTDVYEYVVFRGSDVKDLNVLDIPIDQVRPVTYYPQTAPTGSPAATQTTAQNAPSAPGPTAAYSAPQTSFSGRPNDRSSPHTTQDSNPAANYAPAPVSASPASRASAPSETGVASDPKGEFERQNHASHTPSATPTRTEPQNPTRTSQEAPRQRAAPTPASSQSYDTAFDFEEANKKFEREKQQDLASKPTYDKKSSFFDTISSNEHNNSMRWNEEKNLNLDTFGEAYARRGRGGFRGRGNRGRGNGFRGRGRGNFRGRGSSEPKPEWA